MMLKSAANLWMLLFALLFMGSMMLGMAPGAVAEEASEAYSSPLEVVTLFADNVIEHGRDRYGEEHTPLLVDGVNVDTREPVEWIHGGETWIPSNLASQQNLFRTLVALTNLTGDAKYREAAEEATAYHFDELSRSCGLLQWGGHRFIDLATGNVVGEQDTHELKWSFPFYEFMWEVNPEATERYLKAFWNAHISDWDLLDMNRHGPYGRELGDLWDHPYSGAEPYMYASGLTFMNTGSDLMFAAAVLYDQTGDDGPRRWARRLMQRYVEARNPRTHLGAYQYTQLNHNRDRALRRFGPDFPGQVVFEGTFLNTGAATGIYGRGAICQLRVAESFGEEGEEITEWVREGLTAYAAHAYDSETNTVSALMSDGTRLTNDDIKRHGYYGFNLDLSPSGVGSVTFFSYTLAYRMTEDEDLWEMVRGVARHHGLGDLGTAPGIGVDVNLDTNAHDAYFLLGLLELCRATDHEDYVALARQLADNITDHHFHHGFFVPSPDHINARFDAVEPLALLGLEAYLRGEPELVPAYVGGRGFIHGPHDGYGRTTDNAVIWPQRRED